MEPFGFTLSRPASPLPTEDEFCPRGGRASFAAWNCFGTLSLEEAYQLLLGDPVTIEEQFAHMGPVAFDYYFPVIDRYIRGVDPRDPEDSREARSLGYTVAVQLVDTIDPRLNAEISDLVSHVLTHLSDYAPHKTAQRKVAGAWKRVEKKLLRY